MTAPDPDALIRSHNTPSSLLALAYRCRDAERKVDRLSEALAAERERGVDLLARLDAIEWNGFTGEIEAAAVIDAIEPFRAALAGDTEGKP